MAFFDEVTLAQAKALRPTFTIFAQFNFKSSTMCLWEGDGPLTREGRLWYGLGQRQDITGNPLQSIEGLEQAINGTAAELSMTLSGVDKQVITAARADSDSGEVEGQRLDIYIGFFLDDQAVYPVGNLKTIGSWEMGRPSFIADGPLTRTIKITAENLFASRSRAPFAMLTDRDQERRYPGDKGLEFVPTMTDRTVTWPTFS